MWSGGQEERQRGEEQAEQGRSEGPGQLPLPQREALRQPWTQEALLQPSQEEKELQPS